MRGERQNDCGSARTGKRVRYAGCEAHEGARPRSCLLLVRSKHKLPFQRVARRYSPTLRNIWTMRADDTGPFTSCRTDERREVIWTG